jgi:hypothetical protein
MRQSPSSKDLSADAEEYPLLAAITRQLLVKTGDCICAAIQRSAECEDSWNCYSCL